MTFAASCVVAAALIAGCDSGASGSASRGVLARERTARSLAEREPLVLARVSPTAFDAGVGDGRLEAGRWVPSDAPADRVAVRGDFDLAAADRLLVELDGLGDARLRVGLRRAGKTLEVLELPAGSVANGVGNLDLPPELDATADEIVFAFSRVEPSLSVGEVTLLDRPAAALVPAPGLGPQPHEVGDETRPAYGVTPSSSVEYAVGPEGAATLQFAVANPGERDTRLYWTWTGDVEGRGELVVGPGEAWRVLEAPLFAEGADVRVRFEVEGDGALALSVPRRVERVHDERTVLLVTSDTHRGDHLGFLGAVDVETPNLDALAERGTTFTDARSVAHITNPSHISLFTGVHVRDHGIHDNRTPVADRAVTLAETFRDAGWATIGVVSVRHLGNEVSGLAQGFDVFVAPDSLDYEVDGAADRVRELLREARGRPAFVWLHLFEAHSPYRPSERWRERYVDPGRDPYDEALPAPPRRVSWDLELRDLDHLTDLYRGEVSEVDEQLARVLGLPRVAEGWVAFTADHGERLDTELGVMEHQTLDPGSLHVPLILAGPDVPVGVRSRAEVTNQDLGRTLLDLAGLQDADFPGRDLLASTDSTTDTRFAFARYGQSVSVEADGWLFVRHLTDQTHYGPPIDFAEGQEQLFDLRADRLCHVDLIDVDTERAARLRAELDRFLEASRDLQWGVERSVSDAERAELEALGYAGD